MAALPLQPYNLSNATQAGVLSMSLSGVGPDANRNRSLPGPETKTRRSCSPERSASGISGQIAPAGKHFPGIGPGGPRQQAGSRLHAAARNRKQPHAAPRPPEIAPSPRLSVWRRRTLCCHLPGYGSGSVIVQAWTPQIDQRPMFPRARGIRRGQPAPGHRAHRERESTGHRAPSMAYRGLPAASCS